jgi:tRNA threonylcarbamoyladenosine biosynthesis protein TsaB
MITLAIDTALDQCAVALVADDQPLAVAVEPMRRGHAEALAPMVRAVMAEAGQGFDRIDRVGVTVGPGSFTGVRIGLAFARALGAARARPVIGLTTLEALSLSAPPAGLTCTVLAAGAGWHVQPFRNAAPLADARFAETADAVALVQDHLRPGEALRLIGPGAPVFAAVQGAAEVLDVLPDPVALARAAATRAPPDAPPAAVYLRPPYPNLVEPA